MVDNHIDTANRKCVGCRNCELACSCGAISICEDKEGFLTPVIDEKRCIHCGACTEVCCIETENKEDREYMQIGFIAISKNRGLYKRSASGGIFATIAYQFLSSNKNAVVCGAAFSDGGVRHIIIDSIDGIRLLQGSKYVQSNLGHIFDEIKGYLITGREVLFSGTPCQVNALNLYLKEKYVNLYTIDIICHGVPSPAFLKKDIESYAKNKKIKNVSFRKKNFFFSSKSGFLFSIDYIGRGIKKSRSFLVSSSRDPYFSMFMKGLTFRKSCYQCQFASLDRCGDITVGDCDSAWCYPEFHFDEATSTVTLNSAKGQALWEGCEDDIESLMLDLKREAEYNHQLRHPFALSEGRDNIYDEINDSTIEKLRNKYAKKRDLKERIGIAAFLILPQKLMRRLIK